MRVYYNLVKKLTWVWEDLHNSVKKLQSPGSDSLSAAAWNNSSAFCDKTQQTLAAYTPLSIPWPWELFAPLFSTISLIDASLGEDGESEEYDELWRKLYTSTLQEVYYCEKQVIK